MNKLFSLGTDQIQDDTFRKKIIITNQLNLIFFILASCYSIVFFFFDAGLGLTFLIGTMVIATTWWFNSIGLFDISRFIVVAAPIILAFYTNLIVTKEGETPQLGLSLVQLTLSIIPFVLVSRKEIYLFAICMVLAIASLFLTRPLAGWVEAGDFIEFLRTQTFEYLFIGTAMFIGGSLLIIQQTISENSEIYSKKLLEKMKQKNEEQQKDKVKLDEYVEEIKQTQIEEKQRTWASDGLSLFVDILRSNNDNVDELYNAIIANIIKYMKANQGGLFIVNNEEDSVYIELVASYAYSKRKFLQKRILIGEGLIGQCYLEKEIIFLTEIPTTYVNITSGLGDASPRCVIIVPLINNEKVLGMIEMASFTPFKAYEVEFIQKLSESIAGTIANVKINAQTKRLLEASQNQSEMLRSQEEEMRQNMEELQATQEEMMIKATDFKEFSDVINLFTILIDLSPDGMIMNVNDKFSEIFGYPQNEIIGKKHTYYVPEEAIVSGAFEKLWEELAKGENIVRDVLRMKKDGSRFWLRASYMPMFDKSGKMNKIRCLCFDINKQKKEETEMKKQMEQLKLIVEELSKKK
jgi:PAS domain S-box-containing protein